jgi:hypothetical protein
MTHDYYNNPYKAIQLNAGALELPYNRLLVESRPVQVFPDLLFPADFLNSNYFIKIRSVLPIF